MRKEPFEKLITAVGHCSEYAVNAQSNIIRSYKDDGSVLTETDLYISEYLIETIEKNFPECSIISEEKLTSLSMDSPYIFVLDPIDGTDVYSQGFPSWCIAIGILNRDREPVGSILSAPRWGVGTPDGLLLTLFPGEKTLINGEPLLCEKDFSTITQLVVCSGSYKTLDFTKITGKLRSFGSNILHILAPAIFNHIQAAVFSDSFIWDIAASHAVIESVGLTMKYIDGRTFTYTDEMLARETSSGYVVVCSPEHIDDLINRISRR